MAMGWTSRGLGKLALGQTVLPVEPGEGGELRARHAMRPQALLHHGAEKAGGLDQAQGGLADGVDFLHRRYNMRCILFINATTLPSLHGWGPENEGKA